MYIITENPGQRYSPWLLPVLASIPSLSLQSLLFPLLPIFPPTPTPTILSPSTPTILSPSTPTLLSSPYCVPDPHSPGGMLG